MENAFRSVEFWKSAIMSMPDNSFYELLRSVFGKAKTSCQKQQLINELETFLLRDDIQKTTASYISKNDAKIIAAVALFSEPVPGVLENFFSGELSYAQLQDIIVNLEERFILYRFSEEKTGAPGSQKESHLALNPALKQVLLPFTEDSSALFSASMEPEQARKNDTAAEPHTQKILLNDIIIAGLFSFVTQSDPFFRAEGVIRKRVVAAAKTCFPGLDLKLVIGSLQVLGLFYVDGERLVPDNRQFSDFASLKARERMEYCAASLLACGELKSMADILPPLFRSRIKELAGFIHCFLDSLNAGLFYPENTLKRLLLVLRVKTGVNMADNLLLETLEKTGLLAAAPSGLKGTGAVMARAEEKTNAKKSYISIDSSLSVIVSPEIGLASAINLAAFLNIREAGDIFRFELTEESVIRSFDKNMSADDIIKMLSDLCGSAIDESIVQAVNDWEKLYKEVSLVKGVILNLSENWRYLAKTRPLKNLILETAAPGLYLLPENAMNEAESALRSAGVQIIARRQIKTGNVTSYNNYFPPLNSREVSPGKYSFKTRGAVINENAAAALTDNFHAVLKKIPLGKTEQAELTARIDKRLILCETQLKDASFRYEKLEARHMDYAGKQNIAKQAIAQQSPVEIVLPCTGDTEERFFGVPTALEKEGGELILIVDLTAAGSKQPPAPDQKNHEAMIRRVPLGRISLLRRIKKSIFI